MLAIDELLHYARPAFHLTHPYWSHETIKDLLKLYRKRLHLANTTIALTKQSYRGIRRLASELGPNVERALLVGGPSLPGRVHSAEVYFSLSKARCEELRGWRRRNAERLSQAAAVRSRVAANFDRVGQVDRVEHLKLVVRPGEAAFVEEAGKLIDEGFMVTLDYGADADALVWQTIVHPNHGGTKGG